ncbi:nucleoporin autopeptidase [Teladorsagia circumcincta]|uniref:Nucleoporin autopeptidase n=1 Tax=Teladorsagia circumcincta TaxID=45464 RepID=A0A2G9U097_TELCI|nr:nucleoporin autopeptidase [Teladorsagia circumcincta]
MHFHQQVGDSVKPSPRGRTAAIPGRDLSYTPNVAPPTLGKGIRTNALNSANSITKRSLDGSLINKTVDAAIESSLANGTNMPNSGRRRNLKHLDLSMVMQVLGSRSSEGDDESQGRDPDELPSADNYAVDNHGAYSPELDPREVAIKRGEACRNGTLPRFQLDGSACEESDPLKLIDLGWRDRLEKVTARMGATFKDYRPSTGSWVFRVEHFSKYGLPDDEGDGDVAVVPKAQGGSTHPGNISAHDLDTSLEEHHIQSYVQRARVPRVELHTEGEESNHEVHL